MLLEEKSDGRLSLNQLGPFSLQLALMWRSDNEQLKFDFLENGWPLDEDELKLSRRRLVRLIDWFMDGNHLMAYTIDMPGELLDENAEVSSSNFCLAHIQQTSGVCVKRQHHTQTRTHTSETHARAIWTQHCGWIRL